MKTHGRPTERVATYFPNESSSADGKRKSAMGGSGSGSGSGSASRQQKEQQQQPQQQQQQQQHEHLDGEMQSNGEPQQQVLRKQNQQHQEDQKEVVEDTSANVPASPPDDATLSPSTFQSRLWRVLYNNINRSVDEFYHLCEEEGSEEKCQEIIDLFERTSRDFVKLIERMEEQRKFDLDLTSGVTPTSGVSWEVRKPTRAALREPSAGGRSVGQQTSPKIRKKEVGTEGAGAPATLEKARATKLRAAAAPFLPSVAILGPLKAAAIAVKQPPSAAAETEASATPQVHAYEAQTQEVAKAGIGAGSGLSIDIPDVITYQCSPGQSPVSGSEMDTKKKNLAPSPANSTGRAGGDKKVREKIPKPQHVLQPTVNVPPPGSPLRADDWDEDTEAQVVLASEQVWAEAEAWVEAEAAAEEAAWIKLKEGANKENRSKLGNKRDNSCPSSPAGDWTIPDISPLTVDVPPESAHHLNKKNSSVSRRLLTSPADALRSLSPNNSSKFGVSLIDDQSCRQNMESPPGLHLMVPTAGEDEESEMLIEQFNFKMGSGSKTSNSSPLGNSGQSTPLTGSTGRSLHAKLSSPDRRRALSPTEAKRKHEARQIAAESNRDRSVNERIQKAMIVSVRVKARSEKEAQRLAQAEQALEDKLKDAEKRHGEHIKSIKGKAGNENAKVSEVMFINNLNGEGIAEELQRRLEEAEARILAAGQRRQERLAEILGEKKRKSSKKSQQMSALRLQLERKKMERWRKLQTRLEAVQQRRDARLAEMKRRSDEQDALDALAAGTEQASPGERSRSAPDVHPKPAGKAPSDSLVLSTASRNEQNKVPSLDCEDEKKAKTKRSKKKGSRKLTPAEIKEADENDFLARCLSSATGEDDLTCVLAKVEDQETDAAMQQSWTGPGGADDLGKVGASAALKSLKSLITKRTPMAARAAAAAASVPYIAHEKQTSSGTSSLWLDAGVDLVNFLRLASTPTKYAIAEGSLLQYILMSAGELPKDSGHVDSVQVKGAFVATAACQGDFEETAGGDARQKKKKKKRKSKGLSKNSAILEVDAVDGISLTPSALKALGKEFATVLADDNPDCVCKFVAGGGVALLRIYLGAEVGVLASDGKASSYIATPIFRSACEVAVRCCATPEGREECFSLGVAVLLCDVSHLLLLHYENWSKYVRSPSHQSQQETCSNGGGKAEEATASEAHPPSPLSCPGSSSSESLGLPVKATYVHEITKTWIEADAWPLPALLKSLDSLCRHWPSCDASKSVIDAWIWYVFASGLFSATAGAFKTLRVLKGRVSSDVFFRSLACRLSQFACGASSMLRLSTGLSPVTIVATVSQLSALKHSHPRGREMTSIIRTSGFVPAIISLLDTVLNLSRPVSASAVLGAGDGKKTVSMASLGVSASIVRLLVAFASIDVGIVQNIDKSNQVSNAFPPSSRPNTFESLTSLSLPQQMMHTN